MRQSEYFRYGRPVKLHGFQKYSNEGKKIKFVHPPYYVAQPGTPGRTNLPGHLTDPHGTPIALVYAFRYLLSTIYISVSACSHVPICTPTLLLVHYTPRTKS